MAHRRVSSLRSLAIVAVAYGCSGGGTDSGPHWVFTATVNAGQGDLALDLLGADRSMNTLPPATPQFIVYGDDGGACQHSISFYVKPSLAVESYVLGGWSSGAYGLYTDCHFGDVSLPTGGGPGTLTVARADSSCALPPCIDATFEFTLPGPPAGGMPSVYVTNGHVSNY